MRDIKNKLDGVSSMGPDGFTVTTSGTGVDLRDFDGAMMVFQTAVIDTANGDETYIPSVEESDDDSNYSTVSASDLDGTLVNLTANSVQRVGYKGSKRYIRAVLTLGGTTPSIAASVLVVRGIPNQTPVA